MNPLIAEDEDNRCVSCSHQACSALGYKLTSSQLLQFWTFSANNCIFCMSFSEDLKCWEAWDTTCRYKAKDITPSIAWRREAWKEEALDDLPWKDERGPSSIRWTLGSFQRQCWGNCWEMGWSTCGLFRVHWYYLELNYHQNLSLVPNNGIAYRVWDF